MSPWIVRGPIIALIAGYTGGFLHSQASQRQALEHATRVLAAAEAAVTDCTVREANRHVASLTEARAFVGPPDANLPIVMCLTDEATASVCCFRQHLDAQFGYLSWSSLECH